MVGGSTWGTVYDVRLPDGLGGTRSEGRRRTPERSSPSSSIGSWRTTPRSTAMLRDRSPRDGRYARTMGNHDDALRPTPTWPSTCATTCPASTWSTPSCWSTRRRGPRAGHRGCRGGGRARSPDRLVERSRFRPARSGDHLDDHGTRRPARDRPKVDGLPDEEATRAAARRPGSQPAHQRGSPLRRQPAVRLAGRGATLRPAGRGRTRRRVALDRLRPHPLPDAVAREPPGRAGAVRELRQRRARQGAFSALEWDTSTPDSPLRLVVWVRGDDGPRRHELVPDGPTFVPVER